MRMTTGERISEIDVGPYLGVVRHEMGHIDVYDSDTFIFRLPANIASQARTLTLVAQVFDLGVEHGRAAGRAEAQSAIRQAIGI